MRTAGIVMITDPVRGLVLAPKISLVGLDGIEAELSSFDVCGKSWADPPRDAAELIFNTFKPAFCSGRNEHPSLKLLMGKVRWLEFDGSELRNVPGFCGKEASPPALLVICSETACKTLLGRTMMKIFSMHIDRDDNNGEKAALLLKDVRVPERSLLHTLFKGDISGTELALAPDARRSKGFAVRGVRPDRVEEMRTDYVRRVHASLGCGRHALW